MGSLTYGIQGSFGSLLAYRGAVVCSGSLLQGRQGSYDSLLQGIQGSRGSLLQGIQDSYGSLPQRIHTVKKL